MLSRTLLATFDASNQPVVLSTNNSKIQVDIFFAGENVTNREYDYFPHGRFVLTRSRCPYVLIESTKENEIIAWSVWRGRPACEIVDIGLSSIIRREETKCLIQSSEKTLIGLHPERTDTGVTQSLSQWNLETGEKLGTLDWPYSKNLLGSCVSNNGDRFAQYCATTEQIVIAAFDECRVIVKIPFAARKLLRSARHEEYVSFSTNAESIYAMSPAFRGTSNEPCVVRKWSVPSGKLINEFDLANHTDVLCFLRSELHEFLRFKNERLWPSNSAIFDGLRPSVAVSPSGYLAAIDGGPTGTILCELSTGLPVQRLSGYGANKAFSPTECTLLTAPFDRTSRKINVIKLWSLDSRSGKATIPTEIWKNLSSNRGPIARHAVSSGVEQGASMVQFLDGVLEPSKDVSGEAKDLIVLLDDDEFVKREAAFRRLRELDYSARPSIRAALAGDVSPEVTVACQRLIQRQDDASSNANLRQRLRAVEVLHKIGSEDARAILRRLAHRRDDYPATIWASNATKFFKLKDSSN